MPRPPFPPAGEHGGAGCVVTHTVRAADTHHQGRRSASLSLKAMTTLPGRRSGTSPSHPGSPCGPALGGFLRGTGAKPLRGGRPVATWRVALRRGGALMGARARAACALGDPPLRRAPRFPRLRRAAARGSGSSSSLTFWESLWRALPGPSGGTNASVNRYRQSTVTFANVRSQ